MPLDLLPMLPSKTTQIKRRRRGIFITLEGIEGSGKTTQLAGLAKFLREKGYRVVATKEPGGTPLAEQIREVMLGLPSAMPSERKTRRPAEPMTPECEAALVFAARAQRVTHVIQPIEEGALVLCDRFQILRWLSKQITF
jgi:dTMP kinase